MSSCSLPEGTVHPHVDHCYVAGGVDALREAADELDQQASGGTAFNAAAGVLRERAARIARGEA